MSDTQQTQLSAASELMQLEGQLRNGASWFYWIAGLSVINTAIVLFGGAWSFIIGLGITQVIDAVAYTVAENAQEGSAFIVKGMGVVLDLAVAGLFVVFGWLALQKKAWAFLVGMVLYAMDGMLFLLVQDYLSLGFHAFALFCIFTGYQAMKKLNEMPPELATEPADESDASFAASLEAEEESEPEPEMAEAGRR
jgi:hypothetical protein